MIVVSYDISNDKLRNKFSKYLSRFSHRLQYSVFEIENSNKILKNVICDIENRFSKSFTEADSIYIFELSSSCNIIRYGYARHDEESIIIVR